MRRRLAGCAGWVIGAVGVAGCHTVQYDTRVPMVEEFRAPPDEARFNNPQEQGYRKPPPKKEFKPNPGAMGGGQGMGMGSGPGF